MSEKRKSEKQINAVLKQLEEEFYTDCPDFRNAARRFLKILGIEAPKRRIAMPGDEVRQTWNNNQLAVVISRKAAEKNGYNRIGAGQIPTWDSECGYGIDDIKCIRHLDGTPVSRYGG